MRPVIDGGAETPPNPPRRRRGAFPLAIVALLFLAAPTVGDVGSCNQTLAALDPAKFFGAKQNLDCGMCLTCNFTTKACQRACGTTLVMDSFPKGCVPLEQDGEVCLDALQEAGCSEYASFVADRDPTAPTECDFCPPEDAGAGE
jgi:hypothetical protein